MARFDSTVSVASDSGTSVRSEVRLKSDRRPRLLFLSQTLPYPPDGGVNIRTHHVLRMLSSAFDVTALCFYRRRERPTVAAVDASVSALSRMCHVDAFPIPQEWNRARLLWDHTRSLVNRRAYTMPTYESRAYHRALRKLVGTETFDIVHIDSLDLAGYLPLVSHLPIVCVHHNVESQLLRRRALREGWSARRRYIELQAKLTETIERECCPRFALNVTVSPDDESELRRIAPGARTMVIPNGVDTDAFRRTAALGSGLVCVGGINGFANRDGLEYLTESILPLLREHVPNVQTRWVGRAEREDQASYRQRGVDLTGYVDDVRPYVQNARCFVVPLRVGGGTRVKILDAWAMGMPVVSTTLGCEGLGAIHSDNILIADTPDAFAEAVLSVLTDDVLANRLACNARRTAEVHYSWNGVGAAMIASYQQLVESRATR